MIDYSYRGWKPYGAGEMACIDAWTTLDPWDNDCNPTEDAISNGCRFEVVNEKCAYLIPPTGAKEHMVHFIPANMEAWEV